MTLPTLRKLRWQLTQAGRQAGALGLTGIALLAGALLYAGASLPGAHARLAELERTTAGLHERLQRAAGSFDDAAFGPDEQLANFYGAFPTLAAAPDLLATIYQAAERRGLSLLHGEYRVKRERSGGLLHYQVTLPVQGSYTQVRDFLAEVLQQIPFAALDHVSFEREAIGQAQVEARIGLTLYLGEGA
jgi:hypothetical protein